MHLLLGRVFDFHGFALLFVFGRIGLGVVDHFVDFRVGQPRRGFDADVLLFACAFVFGRHIENAVGVNVKGHFNLRHPARRKWNAIEVEATNGAVVQCHVAFALQDVDFHRGLAVRSG